MRAVALTDIGKVREQNQDRYLIDINRGLFAVCDGMGGHKSGDVAAQMAVDTLAAEFFPGEGETQQAALIRIILAANNRIFLKSRQVEECSNMGTTITVALIQGLDLFTASVGDSSLFIIRSNHIEKVTTDHTLAEKLYQEGFLGKRELSGPYSHVLTRALGVEETVEVDCYTRRLEPGDFVFLASDGLTSLIGSEEIKETILQGQEMRPALEKLLEIALARGGHDNITMVLILVP